MKVFSAGLAAHRKYTHFTHYPVISTFTPITGYFSIIAVSAFTKKPIHADKSTKSASRSKFYRISSFNGILMVCISLYDIKTLCCNILHICHTFRGNNMVLKTKCM